MADWTEADIPDQSGRAALITGANSGIGFEAARALAHHGAHVVLACRNESKASEAEAAIAATDPSGSTEILLIDVGDLDSITTAASSFLDRHDRLAILVNNAGFMVFPDGRPRERLAMPPRLTSLRPVALTALLLPRLLATEGSRVVAISSQAHRPGKIDFDDLQSEKKYSAWGAYSQSKLANLLFTRELQRRLTAAGASTIAVTAHPGGSKTNLGHESPGGLLSTAMNLVRPVIERFMLQDAAMGALPTLRAAVDRDVEGNDYYGPDGFGEQRGHPVKVGRTTRAKDDDVARRLWNVSVELTGADYSILGA